MKRISTRILSAVMVTAVLLLNSCKKDEVATAVKNAADKETSFSAATDNQLAIDNTVIKMQLLLPKLLGAQNGAHKDEQDILGNLDCAIITRDTTVNPHMAYFDFGQNGCTGSDGIHYSGNLSMSYNATDLTQPGNTWTFFFSNFLQDAMSINGTMVMSNDGLNGNGNSVTTVSVYFETNYVKDGLSYNGSSVFHIESITTSFGLQVGKSELYTGGGTACASNGTRYVQTITTPLKVNISPACGHFVSGVFVMHNPSIPDRTVDYGSGVCDNKATITQSGVSHIITLP